MRHALLSRALIFLYFVLPGFAQLADQPDLDQLVLQLTSNKTDYLPGEMVHLTFRITPRSHSALAPMDLSVNDGSLSVFIARGGEYLQYRGISWAVKNASRLKLITLQPGEASEATATLLYNDAPTISHLNPLYARQQMAGRIPDACPLSISGMYLLKAVYESPLSRDRLESLPLTIFVREPSGGESAVWNILRSDPDLLCLIQEGILPHSSARADEDRAISLLDRALSTYGSEVYGAQIRPALEKFRRTVRDKRESRGSTP
jgi:hypothetical protein